MEQMNTVNPTRSEIMMQKSVRFPSPEKSQSNERSSSDATTNKESPKEGMERVFQHYLASNPSAAVTRKKPELEIRFQGINGAPLTKIEYDSVIQHLYASGFKTANPNGIHILRIIPEYVDERSGITKLSNIRAEITGIDQIQEYCKTNSIQHLLNLPSTLSASSNKIVFSQKTQIPIKTDDARGPKFRPVDNEDFRFRIGYQYENEWGPHSELVRNMIETKRWADSKKVFRHLNRVQFYHPELPIFADVTILRTSAKTGGRKQVMIPQYTIQEAKVFQEPESYEVELEIDNSRVGLGMKYNTTATLLEDVRKGIRTVLSAIQGTNYPIGEKEMKNVIHLYKRLIHGENYDPENSPQCSFIGPSSRTLQIENIVEDDDNIMTNQIPNIRYGYTVTDKADGERKMMIVDETGKIYFIDMNMRIQFTGTITAEKKLFSSLFDGEHIKYDKTGRFINLFAVFDVYYINKKTTRDFPFISAGSLVDESTKDEPRQNQPGKPSPSRWKIMSQAIEMMNPYSVLDKNKPTKSDTGKPEQHKINPCSVRIQCKEFYVSETGSADIFQKCSSILSKMKDGLFEYNTDGLIFTPGEYGVGGGPSEVSGPLYKHTWERSFKWKPAEFNTIDFLVRLKKDDKGQDYVGTEFENGTHLDSVTTVNQYKTVILHCGFDERKHGYINPFQQLIDGEFAKQERAIDEDAEIRPESTYGARPFMPTNPADPKACFCNVNLVEDRTGKTYMRTEEGDYFEENMIVEFRYDGERKGAWRWIPLRVRHDKTSQMNSLCGGGWRNAFNKKKQSFGNDFGTANNNWYSIHNPITEEMLRSGENIPKLESVGEDVYYNRKSTESTTRGMRDFHNLYVKMRIINGPANRKDMLIDFAVGKAGDLSKWRAAKLAFVFGVDVSRDNIMNRQDGACARYLTESSKYSGMFDALFLHGNTAKNIRSGEAFDGHKEKMIARAVFGEGPKSRTELGANVYKAYGIAQEGFNISSCQFALHYFFENVRTMHNFVRNVAECTRVGGIFVGTCWDGKTVFDLLRRKSSGESFSISRFGKRIFQITKMYDYTAFPDDELSLGYSISVFQESIGQHIVEYLVNFDFFRRVMENYGFVLMNREEATQFGFPSGGTGMFEGLYYDMMNEVHRERQNRYGSAPEMTEDEKFISFLNRYFIFRKVRNVAAEKITKLIEDNAAALVSPVVYDSTEFPKNEEEEKEEGIQKIAKTFGKMEEIASKEKETTNTKKPATEPAAHFIRPIGDAKITIRTYNPPSEEGEPVQKEKETTEKEPVVEVTNLPIEEGPAIQLAPKTIRVGKTIRVPKNKLRIPKA